MTEATKSDIFRIWIQKKLDENYDYSTVSARNQDLENLINANADKKWSAKQERSLHFKLLNEMFKKNNIDSRTMGFKKKIPKFTPSQTMEVNVTSKPKGAPQPQVKSSPTATDQQQPTTATTQTVPFGNFDQEGVSASISGLYIGLKIIYPELEMLTDSEKISLGKMWLPAFNRFLSENWGIIGIPFLASLGIVAPKLAKARKAKKEKKLQKADTNETKDEVKPQTKKETPKEISDVTLTEAEKNINKLSGDDLFDA